MKILSDLPASARYTAITQTIWAFFGKIVLFYAPLYMKEIGLSAVEIGLISTINLFFSFIWHFLSSTVCNRLGRKRAILTFDLICWTVPMFIWAVAQNFWFFLAAAIINASVKVSSIAWYCLLSEDVEERKRAKVFGVVNVIMATPGFIMPLIGLWMAKFGVVPTLRVFYGVGMVCMTAGFFIRNAYITETQAGLEIMKKHSKLTLLHSLKDYTLTVAKAYKNKHFVLLAVIYVIANFTVSMNFVQILYLKNNLGFGEEAISYTQLITGVVNLLFFLVLMPRLRHINEEKTLAASLAICSVGAILFVLIPGNDLFSMLAAITVSAVGNYLMATFRDAVFMNRLGEHEKSDMFSAVQILTALVCIPSGYLAGLTFDINPVFPFMLIAVLFIIAMFVSFTLIQKNQPSTDLSV